MNQEVLDVDMLTFEHGIGDAKRAVVDGVMKSLETGFVYTSHDMSQDFLDEVYGMLGEFFSKTFQENNILIVIDLFGICRVHFQPIVSAI